MWDRAMADRRAIFGPPPEPAAGNRHAPAGPRRGRRARHPAAPRFWRLEELGYGAVLARDGLEGIALASRYRPDVVLADAFMPKMDGREMCRRLKASPVTAQLKVVIMTAVYTAARYRSEAFREFHADDYLSKPLELKDLRAVLQRLVGSGAPEDRDSSE